MFISAAISRMPARVMPSRMSSVTAGVMRTPSRTMKRFSAEPSDAWPSAVRTSASSKPFSIASLFANAEFTYAPTILLRAGSASSWTRRHETVPTRMPVSTSM
jgi:hypothetical protein